MKRCLLLVVVMLTTRSAAITQVPTYILQRETFNPGMISINFSPDGSLLLAGYTDGSFRMLDPETFETSLEVKEAHLKPVTAMDMPPKMDFIMTAGGNQIKLWDRDGKLKGTLNGHATTIWNADISNDGRYAVSTAINKTFLLWDVTHGTLAEHMRGHEDVTLTACISDNNKLIVSGSNDRMVKIWDLESREVILTLHGPTGDIYDVAFSPDSRMVAAASADESIRIYSLGEEKLLHILKGHRGVVRKVDFSPGGSYLVSASEDHSLILWDVLNGEQVYPFTENEGAVLDVKFHPDGKSIYSVSSMGELTRWEMHPEIFVLRYYAAPYREELSADPVFEPRRKGESRQDHEARMAKAGPLKTTMLQRYYNQYLEEHPGRGTVQKHP
ncbi:MAG: WD40 repeat domain-containing protein [Bacteroidales bacterium]